MLKIHKYLIILLCKVLICLDSSHAYKLGKISNFPRFGGELEKIYSSEQFSD